MDIFDGNNIPVIPTPEPWKVGEYQIWVEPIRIDYGVVAVYAQKHPHVVGMVLFLPERIDMMHECLDDYWGCRQQWEPFDRAVASAIADAEWQHKQRAETEC